MEGREGSEGCLKRSVDAKIIKGKRLKCIGSLQGSIGLGITGSSCPFFFFFFFTF